MRRPWLALVASYGTVVATTSAEGVFQFLIPPYLEQSGYPVSLIGFYYALPFAVALLWRVPAGLLYRPSRVRGLVAGAGLVAAITSFFLSYASGPLAFALVRGAYGVAAATITTVTLAHFMGTIAHGPGRSHAMGYYAGALAGGFTIGNLAGGFVGQRWGYPTAFAVGAAFELGVIVFAFGLPTVAAAPPLIRASGSLWSRWRVLTDPGLAYAALVAFLLNVLFHLPGSFFPLYAVAAGLTLAEVGVIRAAFSFANLAVRGLSGLALQHVPRRQAAMVGIAAQAVALMLVPISYSFLPLLLIMLFVALWRAVGLVASTMVLAEDPDPRRVSRGLASGVYNAAGDLGSLGVSIGGGLLAAQVGVDALFWLLPGVVLVVYVLAATALERVRRDASSSSRPVATGRG